MEIPTLPKALPMVLTPDVATRNASERRAHPRGDDHLYLIAELWRDAIALHERLLAVEGQTAVVSQIVAGGSVVASTFNPRSGHQTVTSAGNVHVDLTVAPALGTTYVVDCFILDAGGTRINANWKPASNATTGFDVDCADVGELYWLLSDPGGNQYTSRSGNQAVGAPGTVAVDLSAIPLTNINYVVQAWILDASSPATKLEANWIPSSNLTTGFDIDCSDVGQLYWILVYS